MAETSTWSLTNTSLLAASAGTSGAMLPYLRAVGRSFTTSGSMISEATELLASVLIAPDDVRSLGTT
jgi:hypothetical protein